MQLIRFLFEYPDEIEKAVRERAPHHIAYYLLELARRFHNYYSKAKSDPLYRVISEDIDRSQAKLYLLRVIKSVLADGLQTLNLTAPEEMRSPES
jgi:arginyl-tRNA synthetase